MVKNHSIKRFITASVLTIVALANMGAILVPEGDTRNNEDLLSDLSLSQESAGASIEVTNPDGSSNWVVGEVQTITWTSSGDIPSVRIELYEENVYVDLIRTGVENDGEYTWRVFQEITTGSSYHVKITSLNNYSVYDFSDPFTIDNPDETEEDSSEDGDSSSSDDPEEGTSDTGEDDGPSSLMVFGIGFAIIVAVIAGIILILIEWSEN